MPFFHIEPLYKHEAGVFTQKQAPQKAEKLHETYMSMHYFVFRLLFHESEVRKNDHATPRLQF